jgi:hypothetical protein
MHKEFWYRNMRKRDNFENLGIDGKIILESILKKTGWEDVDWIDLAHVKVNIRLL